MLNRFRSPAHSPGAFVTLFGQRYHLDYIHHLPPRKFYQDIETPFAELAMDILDLRAVVDETLHWRD